MQSTETNPPTDKFDDRAGGLIYGASRCSHDAKRAWHPQDGDSRCQKCGERNPIWWADNKQWNATVGGPDATDDPGGILCPTCYHALWLGRDVDDTREALCSARARIARDYKEAGW